MASTIKIKNSSTAGAAPTTSDLVQGELAVNVTDKKIYTKNASGTIVNLGTTPSITDNGNAEAIVIDSSENVGVGVTPSSWSTNYKVVEIGKVGSSVFTGISSGNLLTASNVYLNSSDAFTYRNNGYAAYAAVRNTDTSLFTWNVAASGTAGAAATFTQAMTLNASGYLGIGTTSPSSFLHVQTGSSSFPGAILRGAGDDQGWLKFGNQSGDYYSIKAGLDYGGMLFITGGTERARIDGSGNLLVGTTSATFGANGIRLNPTVDGGYLNIGHPSGTASNSVFCGFAYNGSSIGSVTQSGTTGVLFNVTSDQRLKENIVDAPEFGNVIDSVQVRSYDWITDKTHQRAGFIAQELVNVFPEAVYQPADSEQMMAVDYSKLVPMLVKEIQSLRQRVASLEA